MPKLKTGLHYTIVIGRSLIKFQLLVNILLGIENPPSRQKNTSSRIFRQEILDMPLPQLWLRCRLIVDGMGSKRANLPWPIVPQTCGVTRYWPQLRRSQCCHYSTELTGSIPLPLAARRRIAAPSVDVWQNLRSDVSINDSVSMKRSVIFSNGHPCKPLRQGAGPMR